MEKYSVLMSLYYKEKSEYLKCALDSMIQQTVKPDEIVMVYDGKLTDELYSTMDNFIKEYPGLFHIVENENNIGLGLSLKKGLTFCKNEIIARMDTDDISVKHRCEMQLKCFEDDEKLDIVGGNIAEFIDTKENVVSRRNVPSSDEKIKAYMKHRCGFNHMTVMFKKTAVMEAGNYEEWFFNEDYYLWIRMLEKKCVFHNINDVLCYVRVGGRNVCA